MARAELDDPNLVAAVEHALASLLGLLSPQDVATLRSLLRDELTRHPVSARLLKQLAPAPQVQRSGELGTDDTGDAVEASPTRAKSRGSR